MSSSINSFFPYPPIWSEEIENWRGPKLTARSRFLVELQAVNSSLIRMEWSILTLYFCMCRTIPRDDQIPFGVYPPIYCANEMLKMLMYYKMCIKHANFLTE